MNLGLFREQEKNHGPHRVAYITYPYVLHIVREYYEYTEHR